MADHVTAEDLRRARRLVMRWFTVAYHDGFPPLYTRVAQALADERARATGRDPDLPNMPNLED